ncbi:MAG: ABC transporter ATP-binding protein [Bacteroidetes bacterium]|nr:MAG: ABC transporter ATP-binding protein [Bacteroidota bacterium]
MNKQAIIISGISKNYGDISAIKQLSVEIQKGEIFGLIGPDGAGKTTLIRILTTLLLADEGFAVLEGLDIVKDYKKIRKIVGYMPGRFSLYQDLTVEENLSFFASVFETTIEKNYDLIKDIYSHIEPFKKRKAGDLSGGMKQKLALSCALIHKPKVLFLDEPTTGVDAVSRKEFWEMLKKLKAEGITVIVSTPYMDEASLCDRIALMQNGKFMTVNTPENIQNSFKKTLFAIKSDDKFRLLNDLRNYEFTNSVNIFGQKLHYTDKRNNVSENDLLTWLKNKNHKNTETEIVKASIEDCFIEYMSREQLAVSSRQ